MSSHQPNWGYDMYQHLMTRPTDEYVGKVAAIIRAHLVLPLELGSNAAGVLKRAMHMAPRDELFRALASLWMPTKNVFVFYPNPCGESSGLFAETQADGSVEVLPLTQHGDDVLPAPYTVRFRPLEPRPAANWDALLRPRASGGTTALREPRFAAWLEEGVIATDLQTGQQAQWPFDVVYPWLLETLLSLPLALRPFHGKAVHRTAPDGSTVELPPGHSH